MVNAAQVQSLNKKIEQINKEGVKINAQREMLEKQLNSAIAEYESAFGTSLSGKNLSEIKKLVNQEAKKITKEVEKEYNLKEQIVDAISRNDMETAYELLGIPYKVEEDAEGSIEDTPEVEEENENLTSGIEDNNSEDEDDFGFNLSEDSSDKTVKEVAEKPAESKSSIPMHSVEESFKGLELEDSEFKGISVPGKLVIEDDDEETTVEGNAPKGGLIVEDDDEEVDDDFGFGDFFAGTKFDI